MDKQPISTAGFKKLQERLRNLLEIERPAALEAVQKARELGDLSENADYKTAKDQQRQIDSEVRRLESIANNASIIDVGCLSGDKVMFGASVILEDEAGRKTCYKILSEYETDLPRNIIGHTSPLARALIGRKIGDTCIVGTPVGEKEYEIKDVKYDRD